MRLRYFRRTRSKEHRRIIFLFLILLSLFIIIEMYELPDFIRIAIKKNSLKREVQRLKAERDSLRMKLKRLEHEEEIEKLARKKLGMIKEGEKILIVK